MSADIIKVASFDLHETLATPDFIGAVWYEGIPHVFAERSGNDTGQHPEKIKAGLLCGRSGGMLDFIQPELHSSGTEN